MPSLKEMKAIAEKRIKGEWHIMLDGKLVCSRLLNEHGIPTGIEFRTGSAMDAVFMTMIANNWDKLMAVVEAARRLIESGNFIQDDTTVQILEDALEELEKE